MITAATQFHTHTGDRGQQLVIVTVPATGADPSQPGYQQIDMAPWETALGARAVFEDDIAAALRSQEPLYPFRSAQAMLDAMHWSRGYEDLLLAGPDAHVFIVDEESALLLPELVPAGRGDSGDQWLGRRGPCWRNIDHVRLAGVTYPDEFSVAILFQDGDFFPEFADRIRRALDTALPVDMYPGSALTQGPGRRSRLLQEIFFGHRAVLFLGHLAKSRQSDARGWQLDHREVLLMSDLRQVLGSRPGRGYPATAPSERRAGRGVGRGVSVPELVFAACCCGAWRDPSRPSGRGLFYPRVFLDAGVRYFVAPWMDIIHPMQDLETHLDRLQKLICGVFLGWADDPDRTVEHLYRAKQACGFHLMTGLFQIYVAEHAEVPPRIPVARGARVSQLVAGDHLGEYVLDRPLFSDPYAVTFWAHSPRQPPKSYLVQVPILADRGQAMPGLADELGQAVEKLRRARLGPAHLVPGRHERLALRREGRAIRDLHALVYERPDDETPEQWSTLAERAAQLDPNAPDHFQRVLAIGSAVSLALAELHAAGILHGNLDPGQVLFRRCGQTEQVVMKDAWLAQTRADRFTRARYVAPAGSAVLESADRRKRDCFGLGVILFELSCGRPPFGDEESVEDRLPRSLREEVAEHVGPDAAARVPDALDRVVCECLLPSYHLRPAAKAVARRLAAAMSGGGALDEFTAELHWRIQAGHRLFAVHTDDVDPLESSLARLASAPRPAGTRGADARRRVQYHLLVAREEEGLVDPQSGRVLQGWSDVRKVHQQLIAMARQFGQADPAPPDPDQVAQVNSSAVFGHFMQRSQQMGPGNVPVLLIRGNHWWDFGPTAWRVLRNFQAQPQRAPVVVLADRFIALEENLDRLFVHVSSPPPPPAVLFERIVAFGRQEDLPVSTDVAVELAGEMYPCSMRELNQALRDCALRCGTVNGQLLKSREQWRKRGFRVLGTAQYISHGELPDPAHFGLPRKPVAGLVTFEAIRQWAQHVRAGSEKLGMVQGPRRLMIESPAGCGKTALADTLASLAGLPVVRIDSSACLRGRLGESEEALRDTLDAAASLRRTAVLLEGVDELFVDTQVGATLLRMSGIFLNWMDRLRTAAPELVVILTARDARRLPPQWRRRVQWSIPLPEPVGTPVLDYRQSVFAAVFAARGLRALAEDDDLMAELAKTTDPILGGFVHSPFARRAPALAGHRMVLRTPADIQYWVNETILLHPQADTPDSPDFWRRALRTA